MNTSLDMISKIALDDVKNNILFSVYYSCKRLYYLWLRCGVQKGEKGGELSRISVKWLIRNLIPTMIAPVLVEFASSQLQPNLDVGSFKSYRGNFVLLQEFYKSSYIRWTYLNYHVNTNLYNIWF